MRALAHVDDVALWLTVTVGGLAAVGYLLTKGRQMFRMVDVIETLAKRELEHNHGGSIKDDVHGLAIALGEVQRRQDDQEQNAAEFELLLLKHLVETKERGTK